MAGSEGMRDHSLSPGSHVPRPQYKGSHHKGLYEMHTFTSTGLWPPEEQKLLAATPSTKDGFLGGTKGPT